MDHPQQLELDGSHFSHSDTAGWLIRSGASGGQELREMMNTEVGSGSSFLAFALLLWERRLRGGGGGGGGACVSFWPPQSFSGLTPQTSIRRPLQVYLSRDGFFHI